MRVCETYMQHESGLLRSVSESRSGWRLAHNKDLKLSAAVDSDRALRSLFAVSEGYPSLRADANFLQLQQTMANLEAQIADRRELYNAAVSNFNTSIEQVPISWLAGRVGYTPQPFFLACTPAATTDTAGTDAADA